MKNQKKNLNYMGLGLVIVSGLGSLYSIYKEKQEKKKQRYINKVIFSTQEDIMEELIYQGDILINMEDRLVECEEEMSNFNDGNQVVEEWELE
ncbi:MAG: hypothetical protein ACTJGH_04625 [Peptoniphilaceae bacterium]